MYLYLDMFLLIENVRLLFLHMEDEMHPRFSSLVLFETA